MQALAMKRTHDNSARGQGVGIALLTARAITILSAAIAAAMFCSCTSVPEEREVVCRACVPDAAHIDVHGNVYLGCHNSKLLRSAFGNGDTALVSLLGKTFRLTVVPAIHYGAPGMEVLHFYDGKPDPDDRLAVVNGSFAKVAGIARQESENDGKTTLWVPEDGVEFPVLVTIERVKAPAYPIPSKGFCERSNERADYPHLTDAEFANFRPVVAPSIVSGNLYRSSSPIDPSLGRKKYAAAALASCGAKTIWNMADGPDEAWAHSGRQHDGHYLPGCTIHYRPLNTDFNSTYFKENLRRGLLFLSKEQPPYLIHCKEGRDRTGLVAILLEALCGASRAEIKADFAKSFQNYALNGAFDRKQMEQSFTYGMKSLGLDDAPDAELRTRAKKYLRGIGMEELEIQVLMAKLARPVN